ncbi:ABC transporter ATP-binding protein [Megalodesulfovibrio gigas]|uniref:ABC transporter domain-containing protein n=1 Tax=Megalodesulfovibrio gigas (strain ATCC 19364 / DSM 1382 / NCIMB 9332 / VKM B-1759) TaxID=1121448 RepID=T2G7D6_MEGG1|nr:ABC transporter ATP-binding protein [Megalodesulfovibrio gigas]AGW12193.1 hypothetical protein DGI_0262 [Megalodesulfovibrio gigas DSM 1382 = ATCC 19364]
MLEVRNVRHRYGPVQVLHDVSFTLGKGEILGLLGPNGAGKSTTMRILTGFLIPSAGEVTLDGRNIRKDPIGLRKRLGYMPENMALYPELRVEEYLQWVARLKQSAAPAKQVPEVMARCGLAHVRGKLIRHLSKGYQQRVGLAQAILGQTELLILDEPTVGLDPSQIREIRNLIKEMGQEKTILLSTHILPEVELTCSRVLIINKGRIVAEDTPANLARAFGGQGRHLLRLGVSEHMQEKVLARYRQESFVKIVEPAMQQHGPGAYVLESDPARLPKDQDERDLLTRVAFAEGWPVLEFKPADMSLEDAFVNLVRTEAEATEPVREEAAA